MQWIKLYSGTATDPKFRLIARDAGVGTAEALGVWLMLLERAGQACGDAAGFNPRLADIAFDLEDGTAARIIAAMQELGMLDGLRVTAWEARQSVRKGATSTERVKKFRAAKKTANETACNAMKRDETDETRGETHETFHETPCNEMKRDETPLKNKRREEEKREERKAESIKACAEVKIPSTQEPAEISPPAALPPKVPDPCLIELPVVGDAQERAHKVFASDVSHWQELYPAVDVEQELRNMRGWLEAKPARRKTKRGVKAFITSWLAREQDKAGKVRDGPRPVSGVGRDFYGNPRPVATTQAQRQKQQLEDAAAFVLAAEEAQRRQRYGDETGDRRGDGQVFRGLPAAAF